MGMNAQGNDSFDGWKMKTLHMVDEWYELIRMPLTRAVLFKQIKNK